MNILNPKKSQYKMTDIIIKISSHPNNIKVYGDINLSLALY